MKKIYFILLFAFNGYVITCAQTYNISTYAGSATQGFSGDGGPAINAELNEPWGVALDATGNVYIAEHNNHCVRKVNTSGIISTIAGIGTVIGNSGNGGPATDAKLNTPTGVAVDGLGNIYIADLISNCVRVVNTSGIISNYAGNGSVGFSGDGGQATAAEFDNPSSVAVDASGNLYVSDFYNYRVRKINTSGIISTVAGNGSYGYYGDGGPATAAKIGSILGVAVDRLGNIYIPDQSNGRVRKVNTSGIISTFAGNGTQGYSGDGGQATAAELSYPYGVSADGSGNIYIADYNNYRIRLVNTSGIISTIAGGNGGGFSGDGGPALLAQISTATDVVASASGDLVFIADEGNSRIRELKPVETGMFEVSNNKELTVFPNPCNGKFKILYNPDSYRGEQSEEPECKMEVYNITGGLVLTETLHYTQGDNSIDISSQPNGIYIYKAVGNDGSSMGEGKIIIQK